MTTRIKATWLEAQGVSYMDILRNNWKADTFIVNPPHCVVCDRPWRPDYPWYISLMGESYETPPGSEHHWLWGCEAVGISGITTGMVGPSIRRLCTEHADRWESVVDLLTGCAIEMRRPPTRWERAWVDMRYWAGSGMRFAFLLLQHVWFWSAYKVCGYRTDYVRMPWPPLRKAQK